MSVYAKDYGYFFNSNNSDRKYNAESFEEWLKPFFLTGVFNGEMQVKAQSTPAMKVTVSSGYANLDGIPAYWPDDNVITIDTASGIYPRIDTIVLRRDNTNRAVSIEYVKGTASGSPQPVAPTRDSDIFELVLAQILVGTGVTEITTADITDTRMDSDLCGWVAATVDQIDFDQIKAQFDAWQAVNQAQFEYWFQHLQDELDDNQAAHLQNEIDLLPIMIAPPPSDSMLFTHDYFYENIGHHALWEKQSDTPGSVAGYETKVVHAIGHRVGDALAILADRSLHSTAPKAISKGQYVYLWRSISASLPVGLYVATKNISSGDTFTTSNITRVQDGGLNALNSKFVTYDTTDISLNSLDWNGSGMKYASVLTTQELGGIVVSALLLSFSSLRSSDIIQARTNNNDGFSIMANTSSFNSGASVKYRLLIKTF